MAKASTKAKSKEPTEQLDPAALAASTPREVPPAETKPTPTPEISNESPPEEPAPVHLERLGIVADRAAITVSAGYATNRIDCHLTARQAAAAKLGAELLASRGERCEGGRSTHPDGTVVQFAKDFVQWLLDRAADDFEHATGKSLVDDFNLTFR